MHAQDNAGKARAGAQVAALGQPRWGIVDGINPAGSEAKVMLQPEGVLSGWLPIVSPWVGPGWGLHCPLSEGDMVVVIADGGQAEHGMILGAAWNLEDLPPQAPSAIGGEATSATAGELLAVSKAGAVFRMPTDGSVYVKAPTINFEGDLHVEGDVYDRHGSLDRLREHYDAHTHPQPGTSGPSPTDAE